MAHRRNEGLVALAVPGQWCGTGVVTAAILAVTTSDCTRLGRRSPTRGGSRCEEHQLGRGAPGAVGRSGRVAGELKLTSAQYRQPVLGLIFLAYAEHRFDEVRPELEARATPRNPVTPKDYKAKSVLFVPDVAQLSRLVALPEGNDLGKAIDGAMDAVENANPELKGILPRGYQRLDRSTLIELVRLFAPLPRQLDGDAFGLIYEDFLSNFAIAGGPPGRRVLHPVFDRPADRRGDRAVPRAGLRPGLRLGRHVRPVREVHRAAPRVRYPPAVDLRRREDR